MTVEGSQGKSGANLYEVLEVSPRASQDVIQAAYRVLARSCHPDINPSAAAAQRMLELNAAYKVLRDTTTRAEYDLQRLRSVRSRVTGDGPPRPAATTVPHQVRRTPSQPVSAPPPPKAIVAIAIIMVLTLALTIALFLMSALADEAPGGIADQSITAAPASLRLPFEIGSE